jgi:hypothetical protein
MTTLPCAPVARRFSGLLKSMVLCLLITAGAAACATPEQQDAIYKEQFAISFDICEDQAYGPAMAEAHARAEPAAFAREIDSRISEGNFKRAPGLFYPLLMVSVLVGAMLSRGIGAGMRRTGLLGHEKTFAFTLLLMIALGGCTEDIRIRAREEGCAAGRAAGYVAGTAAGKESGEEAGIARAVAASASLTDPRVFLAPAAWAVAGGALVWAALELLLLSLVRAGRTVPPQLLRRVLGGLGSVTAFLRWERVVDALAEWRRQQEQRFMVHALRQMDEQWALPAPEIRLLPPGEPVA